jgi:hypothetical protein
MRRLWEGTRLLTVALLGLAGCHTPNPPAKPPKLPEEYRLPPEADRRYSQPPEYPKDTLNKDPGPKNSYSGNNPAGRGGNGTPNGPGGPGGASMGMGGRPY